MTATALMPFTRPLPEALTELRAAMIAGGWTAQPDPEFDAEDERLAREERQS
jgi:hypothetical protein